jgi:MoxR-like ATPase
MAARDVITDLIARVGKSVIGQDHLVRRLAFALLANGNLLLEGLPGLAKTRAVKALAGVLDAKLSRIQFTPDLLPADITGSEVYHSADGRSEFTFQPGPIFANLVLADEINRAPAKVQSALLEAMEERQVTVAGKTHKMPDLFSVMATQNPIEQEGTYPLPEAQMDRFLMHVKVEYPDPDSEVRVVRLVRSEEAPPPTGSRQNSETDAAGNPGENPKAADPAKGNAIPQQAIFEARAAIHQTFSSEPIEKYIVDLVNATRYPEKYAKQLRDWLQVGASPRGALALDRCSRVNAFLEGRDHVTPDDVRAVAHDVLRHRLMLSYQANAEGVAADTIVDEIVKQVAVG